MFAGVSRPRRMSFLVAGTFGELRLTVKPIPGPFERFVYWILSLSVFAVVRSRRTLTHVS
jgi:hypothetical protein